MSRMYYDDSPRKKLVYFRTLDRNKLSYKDHIDLSDVRGIAVDPEAPPPPAEAQIPLIPYGRRQRFDAGGKRIMQHTPFPVNTRGFFYFFRRPNIPVSSSIRFRVVQAPDPSLFSDGVDLLNEFGTPWQIPVLAIVGSRRYAVLQDVLMRLRPALAVQHSLEQCAALMENSMKPQNTHLGPLSQVIYETGEPFYISLESQKQVVFFAGDDRVYRLYAEHFFKANAASDWPYEAGILQCRLEVRGGGIAVRVLRIVEPVRVKKDVLQTGSVQDEPLAGQLLTRNGLPQRFFRSKTASATLSMKETLLSRYAKNRNKPVLA